MGNYKILVNRPELTSEQMVQSLEFAKVKSYYTVSKKALTKSAFIKSAIIKVVVGATILTSSVVVYKKYGSSDPAKKQLIVTDTVKTKDAKKEENIITNDTNILSPSMSFTKTPAKNSAVVTTQINSVNANNIIHDSVAEITVPKKDIDKKDSAIISQNIKSSLTKSKKPFISSPNAKCSMWNVSSFCEFPSGSIFPTNIDCSSGCEFNYTYCNNLSEKTNIKAIHISVTAKKSKFILKTGFKNITLIRNSSGETIYPIAVGIGNTDPSTKEARYINNTFKSKKCIANFSNKVDIFLFFDDPKVGDKIIIDDFIQVEITE